MNVGRVIAPFGTPGYFFEAPRWHEGRWWVSDQRGGVVHSFGPDGDDRVELRVEGHPSGLGWMPDGSLLIVSMRNRLLLRLPVGASEPKILADLNGLTGAYEGLLNDMVVDANGHAYVGFDPDFTRYGADCSKGMILWVKPNGEASIAADDLKFPNGMVITSRRELVVSETTGERLAGFAIHDDGSLGDRFVWADISGKRDKRERKVPPIPSVRLGPDGCDIDAEDHVWACDWQSAAYRVAPGGDITDAIFLPDGLNAWACALGGEDGHDILLCGSNTDGANRMIRPASRLFLSRLSVPAAS